MKAFIVVDMNNDAFEEPATELSRILEDIVKRVKEGESDFTLLDLNGNAVGSFNIQT